MVLWEIRPFNQKKKTKQNKQTNKQTNNKQTNKQTKFQNYMFILNAQRQIDTWTTKRKYNSYINIYL